MVGGVLVSSLSILGLFSFSFLLFMEGNLYMAWFFLELAGISLIPLFFSIGSAVNVVGLFYYLIVSGVSSGLLLSGVLFSNCVFFIVLGFLIKFGIFPFMGWVYGVLGGSNWLVVWGFSGVLKISFVMISFFLVLLGIWSSLVVLLCSISCVLLSIYFWVFSSDWKSCWCHMMLSSSSVLVCLSFCGSRLDSILCVFIFYFFWSSLVILFFYWYSLPMCEDNSFLFIFLFCFLLLTLPVSISIFYKISVCLSIFSCGIVFLLCWLFYSISEQAYFIFFVSSFFNQKCDVSLLGLV